MRLLDLYQDYTENVLEPKGTSKRTYQNYETMLSCYVDYAGNPFTEEIKHQDINQWATYVRERCSGQTAYTYVTRIRTLLYYAQKIGETEINFDLIITPKVPQKIPNFIEPSDVDYLLRFCNNYRDKAILSTLSATGLRAAELLALNRDDITEDQFYVTGKGAKDRYVFLDARSRHFLDKYLDTRKDDLEALFVSRKGNRLATSSLGYALRQIGDRANKPLNAHALRHGFATDLMNNGANIHLIKELLGHSNIEMTEKYLHLTTAKKLAGYKRYHNKKY